MSLPGLGPAPHLAPPHSVLVEAVPPALRLLWLRMGAGPRLGRRRWLHQCRPRLPALAVALVERGPLGR